MRSLANSMTLGAASAKPLTQLKPPKKHGSRPRLIASLVKSHCSRPSRTLRKRKSISSARSPLHVKQQAKVLGTPRLHEPRAPLA